MKKANLDQAEKLWMYLGQLDDAFVEEAQVTMSQNAHNVYGLGLVVPASRQIARDRAAKYGATVAGLSSVVAVIYFLMRRPSSKKRARAA